MSAPVLQLSVAAAHLLNAARASGRTEFGADDLHQLLPEPLRYTRRGVDARPLSPASALDELIAAGLAAGSAMGWEVAR